MELFIAIVLVALAAVILPPVIRYVLKERYFARVVTTGPTAVVRLSAASIAGLMISSSVVVIASTM